MSNFNTRKRTSKDKRCLLFPDDLKNGLKKSASALSRSTPSCAAKSWERCGEGFSGTPGQEKSWSSRKKNRIGRQMLSSISVTVKGSGTCKEDIEWSSSGSELSDSEMRQPSEVTGGNAGHQKEAVRNPFNKSLSLFSSVTYPEEEELHKIDWDSDLNDETEEMERLAKISDSDSPSKEQKHSPKHIQVLDVEISDFSDSESSEHRAQARCEHGSWQPSESSRRSASDWVRSAQAVLRTPQKQHSGHIKSPEDSAKKKKKKKFLSGGLAERLNRLQCRQSSSISFWRHQSISNSETPAVHKAGVLVLKLLSVWEDCSMQVATCQWANGSPCPESTDQPLILFSRDTATHLVPSPGDTIHVFPPWQKLLMEGGSNPVILNTHFSQKVLKDVDQTGGQVSVEKCPPYSLTRVFSLMEKSSGSEEEAPAKQIETHGAGKGTSNSLLEVIEGHGVSGWMGRDVSVVVQRVYCLPIQEATHQPLLKHRAPETESLRHRSRLCLLVQDEYGLFSEVALHTLSSEDNLQQYIWKWEGKCCVLRGMKVLQRVTRSRSAGLFSLIDSLWPPMVPLKDHGKTQSGENDGDNDGSVLSQDRAKLPAPSFCYLLSGQSGQDSVDVLPHPKPDLYQPAVVNTLREILQRVPLGHHCSFTATVIYKRLQSCGPRQGESWLFVTDASLQTEEREESVEWSRTLGVCMSFCVLHPDVLQTLGTSSACTLTFKDTVREHGLIQCVERSVVQLNTLTSAEVDSFPTGGPPLPPARLDQLGPATTANSLCTVQGVVIGVDEDTAYSWPVCNLCGSDQLEAMHEDCQKFFCRLCGTLVDSPTVKMQLEVFLSCASCSQGTVKIKLQQDSINSVLNSTELGSEGYTVENVLGKELGPLTAYVRVVTRKPTLWVGLEEVSLSEGYSNEAPRESAPTPRDEGGRH